MGRLTSAALFFFLSMPAFAGERPTIAILGDSLSTGAATHPSLTFDSQDLWKVFMGQTSVTVPEPAPQRLWPAPREYLGGPEWVFRHLMQTLSRAYLDTEQYSWGYQIAQARGLPADALVVAGEDGARTASIPRHVDRLLDAYGERLPKEIYLFYTGNDLCGPALQYVTTVEQLTDYLTDGLRYMVRNGTAAEGGTDVYVMSFLSVLQLLHSDAILNKRVKAFGKEMSCKELREQGYRPKKDEVYDPGLPPEAWYFAMMMPPNPAAFCPTLFGSSPVPGRSAEKSRDDVIGVLANRIRDFRKAQQEVVGAAAKDPAFAEKGFRIRYVAATADLAFAAEDIAPDCFHLSRSGHAKVAAAVRAELQR